MLIVSADSLVGESIDEIVNIILCVADLRERLLEQGMLGIVNGEYLSEVDSIEYLQVFEKEKIKLREPTLKGILKKLQAIQSNGLTREKYDKLKNKLRARKVNFGNRKQTISRK